MVRQCGGATITPARGVWWNTRDDALEVEPISEVSFWHDIDEVCSHKHIIKWLLKHGEQAVMVKYGRGGEPYVAIYYDAESV